MTTQIQLNKGTTTNSGTSNNLWLDSSGTGQMQKYAIRGNGRTRAAAQEKEKCEYPTKGDGSPCRNPASHGKRCHVHEGKTVTCGYPVKKNNDPCQNEATEDDDRCWLHTGMSESDKYDNACKACFHALKGALRFASKGHKGVDENRQVIPALHIAAHAARAFLQHKQIEYDRERSHNYHEDNFVEPGKDEEDEVIDAIEKAWSKTDSGNHKGGCRIAIAAIEKYLSTDDVDFEFRVEA